MTPFVQRLLRDGKALAEEHRKKLPYIFCGAVCLVLYAASHLREEPSHLYRVETAPDFKDARILGSQSGSIYEGKEKLLSKTMRELLAAQASLREANEKLQTKVAEMEKGKPSTVASPLPQASASPNPGDSSQATSEGTASSVRVGAPPEVFETSQAAPVRDSVSRGYRGGRHGWSGESGQGRSIISFPVKDIATEKTEGVVLPAGSYVKAKLMTGVEAPEGKTYPVLLQLDYAYVVPNKHKLDLAGCFMIAKSQGDLSTERVQMQASKLSCVSKEGRMFERDVNGFVADDKDNSFAVIGSVNSKQDRVAAMAFLSSIVEGVGKAIQQAQTTQQTTPLGGSQSVLTGDKAEYMVAGGASNAASMVTQWYLKQAQNLLPTINVGSGQDVWIVMQETVKLPNDYFKKNKKGGASEGIYTYFSRVLD